MRQSFGINGGYVYQGTTKDGNPYYKNELTEQHLFYDANCGGGVVGADGQPVGSWRSGWFVGCGRPDTTAVDNLQHGTEGDCCNSAPRAPSRER